MAGESDERARPEERERGDVGELRGPFKSWEETRECIEIPLAFTGSNIVVPDEFAQDIHRLTEGHPYLVQLTCHVWFKHQHRNGREHLDFSLDPKMRCELRQLANDLPHPAIREFWRRV